MSDRLIIFYCYVLFLVAEPLNSEHTMTAKYKSFISAPTHRKKYIYLLTTYSAPTTAMCHLGGKQLLTQTPMYYGKLT